VKLVLAEDETAALRATLLTVDEVVSSELIVPEVLRACRREAPDLLAFAEAQLQSLSGLVTVDKALLRDAGEVGPPALRTLDAVHLATAERLRSGLAGMITYDQRLAEAAAAAGFEVASPGRDERLAR
jgi:predicted nucleic acid-binding protein